MTAQSSHRYSRVGREKGVDDAVLRAADRQIQANLAHASTPVLSLRHLSELTETPYGYLRDIVARSRDPYMDLAQPKKSGGLRMISAPEPWLMNVQRWILRNCLDSVPLRASTFAYRRELSIVDCARAHVGAAWLVKLDLHDFFGSIGERRTYRVFRRQGYSPLVAFEMTRITTRQTDHTARWRSLPDPRYSRIDRYRVVSSGVLPQGGPASGMIANACATSLDERLEELASRRGATYTRYSDDLTFSSSGSFSRSDAVELIRNASGAISAEGFTVHHKKSRVVPPGARHVVLGLLVADDDVRLLPEFRNRISNHVRGVTKFGLINHALHRKFRSALSFVNHIDGSIAFAVGVDPEWAERTRKNWEKALAASGWPF